MEKKNLISHAYMLSSLYRFISKIHCGTHISFSKRIERCSQYRTCIWYGSIYYCCCCYCSSMKREWNYYFCCFFFSFVVSISLLCMHFDSASLNVWFNIGFFFHCVCVPCCLCSYSQMDKTKRMNPSQCNALASSVITTLYIGRFSFILRWDKFLYSSFFLSLSFFSFPSLSS